MFQLTIPRLCFPNIKEAIQSANLEALLRNKTGLKKKKKERKPGLEQELSPLLKCLEAGGHAPDPHNPHKTLGIMACAQSPSTRGRSQADSQG